MNTDQKKALLQKTALILIGLSSLGLLGFLLTESFTKPRPPPSPRTQEPSPSPEPSPSVPSPTTGASIPRLIIEGLERPEWRGENTKVSFALPGGKLAIELKVYQKLTPGGELNREKVNGIAKNFGFSGLPREDVEETETLWSWVDGAKTLSLNFNSRSLDYSVDRFIDPSVLTPGKNLSQDEAIKLAKNFLATKNLPNSYLDLDAPVVEFSGAGSLHGGTLESTAREIAVVNFPYKINDYPLLLSNSNQDLARVIVSSKGVVIGLKIKLYDATWQEAGAFKLLSLEKAKEAVSKGGGVMIENSATGAINETLSSYQLNKVFLAYYGANDNLGFLQPAFIFEGEGTLQNGSKSSVVLFLPAVEY